MRTRTALAGGTLLVALGVFTTPLHAAVVDLQASKDNTLYFHSTGELSNGAGTFLFAGNTALSEARRGLVKFDVAAGIPAGSTINSATLKLYYDNTFIASNGTRTTTLRRASADWGEGASVAGGQEGGGAPPAPGDATWIHTFYSGSLWGAPGGVFSGVTSASASVGTAAGVYTWTGAQLAADVQSMLDAPAGNHGWGIFGVESTFSTAKRFVSRDHTNAARRPVLTVDFTPPVPGMPAWGPLALATLLLAAAFPLMRRRETA